MERITDEEAAENGWFWNEQVGSYRPAGAMYCRECKVRLNKCIYPSSVHSKSCCNMFRTHSHLFSTCYFQALVYDYDHVCPWTGTAIGKGNMLPFKIFVFSVNVLCYLSVGLVIWQVLTNIT